MSKDYTGSIIVPATEVRSRCEQFIKWWNEGGEDLVKASVRKEVEDTVYALNTGRKVGWPWNRRVYSTREEVLAKFWDHDFDDFRVSCLLSDYRRVVQKIRDLARFATGDHNVVIPVDLWSNIVARSEYPHD